MTVVTMHAARYPIVQENAKDKKNMNGRRVAQPEFQVVTTEVTVQDNAANLITITSGGQENSSRHENRSQ